MTYSPVFPDAILRSQIADNTLIHGVATLAEIARLFNRSNAVVLRSLDKYRESLKQNTNKSTPALAVLNY